MAKFHYDYEFHAHEVKAGLFSKRSYQVIEQIQLGMVDEQGRTLEIFYNDFDTKAAWNNKWLRDNIFEKYYTNEVHGVAREHIHFNYRWFKKFIEDKGVSKTSASILIRQFIYGYYDAKYNDGMSFSDVAIDAGVKIDPIELVAYYADYDHIAFCTTFGGMMDLPEHFPMYTVDLKQEFDRLTQLRYNSAMRKKEPSYRYANNREIVSIESLEGFRDAIKQLPEYPVNKGEHSAVFDAEWNKELDKFLKTI